MGGELRIEARRLEIGFIDEAPSGRYLSSGAYGPSRLAAQTVGRGGGLKIPSAKYPA